MANKNFLGDEAVRQVSQTIRDVRNINARIARLEKGRRPNTQRQIFVKLLDSTDSSNANYDATQVYRTGDSWTEVTEGRHWASDSTLGYLKEFNDTADTTGVYPVWQTLDGTSQWFFEASADSDIYYLPFARQLDGTDVSILPGKVFYGSEDNQDGVDVDTAGTWQLDTTRKFYVEWTSKEEGTGEEAVINGVLQTTTGAWPDEWDDDGEGDLTCTRRIGEIKDDTYVALWENDIYFMYPFQPEIPESVRSNANDPTAGYTVFGTGDSVSDHTDKNIIFSAKSLQMKVRGGGMKKLYDDATENDIEIGGVDVDISGDIVSADTSTENQITLSASELAIETEYGLVQDLTKGTEGVILNITSDGKQITIEPGAHIKHDILENTAENRWARITHDGTNWSDGNLTGADYTQDIGPKGHIIGYAIDGTEVDPPEDDTNYKYVNCENDAEFIVADTSTDGVFRLSMKCWEFYGETAADVDSTISAVDYTDCSDCLADQTNDIFIDCVDGSTEYYVQAGTADEDALWVCNGGTLKKAEVQCRACTSEAISVTSVLLQCGTTALDCDDLVGWPGEDDFGGTGCDSGAVNDENYDMRWSETKVGTPTYSVSGGALNVDIPDPAEGIPISDTFTGTGTDSGSIGDATWDKRWTKTFASGDVASDSITGSNLVVTVNPSGTGGNQAVRYEINQSSNHSGDFYFEVPLTVAGVDNPGGPSAYLRLDIGGTLYIIGYQQDSNGNGWFWRVGGTSNTYDASLNGAKTLSIERTGSTITFRNGGASLGTATQSGTITRILLWAANTGGGTQITQDVTYTYGYIEALDAVGGDPIEITQAASESSITLANNIPSQSGDFAASVDIFAQDVTGTGDGPKAALVFGDREVGYVQNGAVDGWYWYDGSYHLHDGDLAPSGNICKIQRESGTLKMLIDGTEVYSAAYATSGVPKLVSSNFIGTPVDGIDCQFDDFEVNDNAGGGGMGANIYIDPTGNSC